VQVLHVSEFGWGAQEGASTPRSPLRGPVGTQRAEPPTAVLQSGQGGWDRSARFRGVDGSNESVKHVVLFRLPELLAESVELTKVRVVDFFHNLLPMEPNQLEPIPDLRQRALKSILNAPSNPVFTHPVSDLRLDELLRVLGRGNLLVVSREERHQVESSVF